VLIQKLQSTELPIDINCSSVVAFSTVNNYTLAINDSRISTAETAIPHTCLRQDSGRIAGWSEHVQPLCDKSMFWHKLWLDCDRPRTGAVADSMRRTRAVHH
jgi:hypothetical protein